MTHGAEDCASVLEQFVHDVANLPAEMNHLMEEIQAKDKTIQECRSTINSRDGSLQKFIKLNGSLAPNTKEEPYGKTILQNYDKSQLLQDEKIHLSEKACVLLDRQIKKLDVKIRDLQNDGVLSNDPPIPSLFNSNKDQYRDPPKIFFPESTTSDSTSYASPLNPTSGNANIALGVATAEPIPGSRGKPICPKPAKWCAKLCPRNTCHSHRAIPTTTTRVLCRCSGQQKTPSQRDPGNPPRSLL